MTPSERARDERVLAEFDQLFASKPDALTALYTVVQATATNLPLPPVVAEWLNQRICECLLGRAKTLDAALGLASVKGRHSAVSRFNESIRRLRWRDPISALHELASLGAAIDDAALVVATKYGVSASTLARKYRDLNLGEQRKVWAEVYRAESRETIEELLAQYPDDAQSRPVKTRIRTKLLR
jgi:hypothetical protein